MKLIVGLGNPGKKFEDTRHNVGFLMADAMQKTWGLTGFEMNKKLKAELSKGTSEKGDFLIVKPQTYMNLSGESVRIMLHFYKLTPEDIIVIHDDLDIPLGKMRVSTDSSSAGHNGVQNIIDKLGTQKFSRIRIGIGQEQETEGSGACRIGAHDFVLEKFSPEELEIMEEISDQVVKEVKKLL